jgi:hypothetical protein
MPEITRKDHFHPTPGAQIVKEIGSKLSNSTSDVFRITDLVASPSGRWETISRSKVGQPIPANDTNYYIRPVGAYTS